MSEQPEKIEGMRFNHENMAWEPAWLTTAEIKADLDEAPRYVLTRQEYDLLKEYEEPFEQITWEEFEELGGQMQPGVDAADLSFTGTGKKE